MASGGDLVAGFEQSDAFVAVRSVAMADVAGEGPGKRVPVDVVGVVDDEHGDREEVALDRVEVAGVGRGRDELDGGAATSSRTRAALASKSGSGLAFRSGCAARTAQPGPAAGPGARG